MVQLGFTFFSNVSVSLDLVILLHGVMLFSGRLPHFLPPFFYHI